jgi:predicted MFS family arabinose efflux permease
MLAYALLAVGYFLVGQLTTYWTIAGALLLVALGASLIKPTITGTVQKTCSESQRATGFSIYYMLVNIGGMIGNPMGGQIADRAGVGALYIVLPCVILAALALVAVFFEQPVDANPGERKSAASILKGFGDVLTNVRLVALFLCAAGFWALFFLLYGPLSVYVTKHIGATKSTYGALLSIESFVVVFFQVVVGYLTRSFAPARAVLLGWCSRQSAWRPWGSPPRWSPSPSASCLSPSARWSTRPTFTNTLATWRRPTRSACIWDSPSCPSPLAPSSPGNLVRLSQL